MFCKWILASLFFLGLSAEACLNAPTEVIQSVCQIVNSQRSQKGRKSLVLDSKLSDVAQAYAEDMAIRNYFSHINPEGQLAGVRLRLAGISWKTWGENIAAYHATPKAVMRAWMNSSGHRANILNPKYGKIGIGYYQGYWVQIFTD